MTNIIFFRKCWHQKNIANMIKCEQLLNLGDGQMANGCSSSVFYAFVNV